jgi:thioredoxin-related protein
VLLFAFKDATQVYSIIILVFMAEEWFKRFELAANIAIIAAAVIVSVLFIRNYLNSNNNPLREIKPGTKISLNNTSWSPNTKTLILALKKDCKYCSESSSFYRRLEAIASESPDFKIIIAMPDDLSESKKYLEENKLAAVDVRQVPLTSINVVATPTLLLVDDKGEVITSWIGKLKTEKEAEVINSIKSEKVE